MLRLIARGTLSISCFVVAAGCTPSTSDGTTGATGVSSGITGGLTGGDTDGDTDGSPATTSSGGTGGSGDPSTTAGTDPSGGTSTTGGGTGGVKFDLGVTPDAPPDDSGGCDTDTDGCTCTIPEHVPCDAGTGDLFEAMGLNCPGELQVNDSTSGPTTAMGLRSAFGATNTYDPREGDVYAVLGSGLVGELDSETPASDGGLILGHASPTYCNDDLGAFDPGNTLPAPLRTTDVGNQDCVQNPALIGTGDCSNTIQGQFDQGGSANDYVEMRFDVQVPPDVTSFSYDFAFFSTEYPYYYNSAFNDMYVGWLESELWTGNISFDAMGNPISLNAGFLDFKDDGGNLPELDNTCMKYHAGTNWLTSTASVTGGESITVVFAVFDLSDSILDSYVFLDNFQWGCEPTGKPETKPPG